MASAPASAEAENAAGRLWAANQWKASSAVTPVGETDSSGSASSARASAVCSGPRSPGSRSSASASRMSAWRKPYAPVSGSMTMMLWATASRRPPTSSSGPIAAALLEQPMAHPRAGDGREAKHALVRTG